MGNAGSMDHHNDFRGHHMPSKLPMPEQSELEERFAIVLNSMNLPPDKARLLRQYDNEKKWELICDQERFQVKNPPHTYIQKLRSYLDPAVTRKKFRRRVQESTQVLRELEISLRTNHIGWVREFLNEENKGLDVLVEYLSFAQYAVTFDGDCAENNLENSVDKSKPWSRSIEDFHGGGTLPSNGSGISRAGRQSTLRSNTLPSRRTLKNSRLVCRKDDVHVCIMCLRAIMNYQEQMLMEKLLEQEAMMEEEKKSPSKSKHPQRELIQELRKKQVKDSRHVYEGKDGTIEDIITVLKTVPFTARTAKRGSRFFCDPALSDEYHY
ncbi:unnamed protein product [Arctogadus glacialis]